MEAAMRLKRKHILLLAVISAGILFAASETRKSFSALASSTVANAHLQNDQEDQASPIDSAIDENAERMMKQGRTIFRFDTFGDEAWWGDTLKLHQAVAGAKLGGVGGGVSPKTALAVGLKVDVDA